MAILQNLNQQKGQNALQMQNETDVLLFLVCFSYTMLLYAKYTQNAVSLWITAHMLELFIDHSLW